MKSGLALVGLLILSGCGKDTPPQQTVVPEPVQEAPPVKPPEMVSIVRLTNGSVLHAKTVSTEGEVVTLKLPDLGEVTFTKAEIASIEEIPAETVSVLATQADETRQGLVYVNGQWTSPKTARQSHPQQYSSTTKRNYYPKTEEGLVRAQRALEQAIKNKATSEIHQLTVTIQEIRSSLGEQQERMRNQLKVKQQVEKAKQAVKTTAKGSKKPRSAVEASADAVNNSISNPDISIDSGPPVRYETSYRPAPQEGTTEWWEAMKKESQRHEDKFLKQYCASHPEECQ